MRVNGIRVIVVFACIAVALATGALPAYSLTLPTAPTSPHTFFPMDKYSGDISAAFSMPGDQKPAATSAGTAIDHSFMTQALNMVPASDDQTSTQMNGIKTMEQNYQPKYTTAKTSSSWMDPYVQPTAIDGSSNPAESAYSALIKGKPGMANIFQG